MKIKSFSTGIVGGYNAVLGLGRDSKIYVWSYDDANWMLLDMNLLKIIKNNGNREK